MLLGASFPSFVEDLARVYFAGDSNITIAWNERMASVTDIVRLGHYGEGYLTSLASARRILRKFQGVGIIGCHDQQFGSEWRMNTTVVPVASTTP